MTAPRTAERSSAKASSARTVLQITDTHLQAPAGSPGPRTLLGVDTSASLSAVLHQALGERKPDAVIASGDLAHEPEPVTYRRFHDLLAEHYQGPVLYLAGNHDLSEPLGRVLGGADSLGLGNWEVIAFDSHADHRTEASFDADDLRTLTDRIRASRADHVLLACHHHLLPVGCPWLDKDCIPQGGKVLESVAAAGAPNPRVRGLVFGHVHQEVRISTNGMRLLGTPSTCFQFEPRSESFAIDRSEDTGRPGYRWLDLHSDGTLGSELCRVAGYHLNIDLSDRS